MTVRLRAGFLDRADALAYRDALDELEGMPRPLVYPSGRPVPTTIGQTEHVGRILEHAQRPEFAVEVEVETVARHDGVMRTVRGRPVTIRSSDLQDRNGGWTPDPEDIVARVARGRP